MPLADWARISWPPIAQPQTIERRPALQSPPCLVPPEILELIVTHLLPTDASSSHSKHLAQCARVSKDWMMVASRPLWSHPEIIGDSAWRSFVAACEIPAVLKLLRVDYWSLMVSLTLADISGPLESDRLLRILPRLVNLRDLAIYNITILPDPATTYRGYDCMTALRVLSFELVPCHTARILASLLRLSPLLTDLTVAGTGLPESEVCKIFEHVPRLERLRMGTRATVKGSTKGLGAARGELLAIAIATHCKSLQSLDLTGTFSISPLGLAALLSVDTDHDAEEGNTERLGRRTRLKRLSLRAATGHLPDRIHAAILGSPHTASCLTSLTLTDIPLLTDATLVSIFDQCAPTLVTLELANLPAITDDSMRALSSSCKALQQLRLHSLSQLRDIAAILASPPFRRLEDLMAAIPVLPALEVLWLSAMPDLVVTDNVEFVTSAWLLSLQEKEREEGNVDGRWRAIVGASSLRRAVIGSSCTTVLGHALFARDRRDGLLIRSPLPLPVDGVVILEEDV
ncbi:hypothetical protein DFJ73DRAFT_818237 [Zopfochytrium polystomum]|nr:hypothetical protein DFJ73DRAFT_818237 [Zopfochytrium polystomum]